MLRELGAHVLDADEIAREVVEPGQPALAEVAARFPGVLGADGRLDRAALAARIFGNEGERRALNAILHPSIQQSFVEKSQALASQGVELIVYDAALLIENGLHALMNGVILVTAPPATQVSRLVRRNRLTEAEAQARIDAQLPMSEKAHHATWIIDNSGHLDQTREQVKRVWAQIHQQAPPGTGMLSRP
jgi:dephospho-CoA kinase